MKVFKILAGSFTIHIVVVVAEGMVIHYPHCSCFWSKLFHILMLLLLMKVLKILVGSFAIHIVVVVVADEVVVSEHIFQSSSCIGLVIQPPNQISILIFQLNYLILNGSNNFQQIPAKRKKLK